MVGMKRHTNGLTCSGHDPGGAAVVQTRIQSNRPRRRTQICRRRARRSMSRSLLSARATAHEISTWRTNRASGASRRAIGRPGRRMAHRSLSMPRPARASSSCTLTGPVSATWDPAATPIGRSTAAASFRW